MLLQMGIILGEISINDLEAQIAALEHELQASEPSSLGDLSDSGSETAIPTDDRPVVKAVKQDGSLVKLVSTLDGTRA